MTETTFDAQKRKEAQRRYDQLTARIAALDTDIGRSLDAEHKFTAQQARADLVSERDAVAAEMISNDKRTNGDLDILQRKVFELGRALASDHPQEAHEIINECVAALSRLDSRVLGLEGRVDAIERHIHPPWIVSALRLAALFTMILAVIVGAWQFDVLVMYPIVGVMLEGALISLAVATLFFANAKLRERVQ